MKDITQIDKNFQINTNIQRDDMKVYDIKQAPFKIYGVKYENGKFRRMPEAAAKSVGEKVYELHTYAAGGRVRFKTNSPYIALIYKGWLGKMPHFAYSGSAGFDIYFDTKYAASCIPEINDQGGFQRIAVFEDREMKNVTINFPLYSEIYELYIGLADGCVIEEADEYRVSKPIVYYGSSITQGGCSSRPGTCYEPYITRRFDCDHINLGFSGSALGEVEIAEYIAGLSMSLFVYDYDFNAPTKEHLAETHERMFKIIREKNPSLPIIMMSRPKAELSSYALEKLEIIKTTYENAKAAGDNNVYLIDGRDLCKICGNEGLVDGVHPTDFGFFSMATVLGDFIEENGLL